MTDMPIVSSNNVADQESKATLPNNVSESLNQMNAKSETACLQSQVRQQVIISCDTGSSSDIHNLCSDTSVLQDQNSRHNVIDNKERSDACLHDTCLNQVFRTEHANHNNRGTWISNANLSKSSEGLQSDTVLEEICQESECLVVCEAGRIAKMNDIVQSNGPSDSCQDGKDYYIHESKTPYIGSQMALKAVDAATVSRSACERFMSATGRPIAEFERFLHDSSPIVIPAVLRELLKPCEGVFEYLDIFRYLPVTKSVDYMLQDVWSWYERPGYCGLEVKAQKISNKEGIMTDDSFRAYFVPYLSAVQLFAYRGQSGLVADSSTDSEVIFEYFEHEPPHQRKPLYAKVKELMEVGSSCKVFGDRSMLECAKLQDLHPASWYSVAWYPIYRDPEGRHSASFLTYHSLGRLCPRHVISANQEENASCDVAPVFGMLSYNAQDEHWLDYKEVTEYHLRYCKGVLNSEILVKRVRTLEENAALFARGHVRKGEREYKNKHPDYEFFCKRRR